MALLYVNDDRDNPAGSDTTLRDAPDIARWYGSLHGHCSCK